MKYDSPQIEQIQARPMTILMASGDPSSAFGINSNTGFGYDNGGGNAGLAL